jgi:hypothetical protein
MPIPAPLTLAYMIDRAVEYALENEPQLAALPPLERRRQIARAVMARQRRELAESER